MESVPVVSKVCVSDAESTLDGVTELDPVFPFALRFMCLIGIESVTVSVKVIVFVFESDEVPRELDIVAVTVRVCSNVHESPLCVRV